MNKPNLSTPIKPDQRYKFSRLQVLLVDNDMRSAHVVKQILEAFGLKRIIHVRSGEDAMTTLRSMRINLVLLEWKLGDTDGVTLIKTIRAAKNEPFMQLDTPVVMLTGLAKEHHVRAARDAGITEFLAKPFTAKTLSTRLIEIIDRPREFVESEAYKGPSRRRRMGPPPGTDDRRLPRDVRERMKDGPKVTISKPNYSLRDLLDGTSAADIITPELVERAHAEVMKSESDFVTWVKEDIERLEEAYLALATNPTDKKARVAMLEASYAIKSQSGIFGYEIGTVVADLLVSYLSENKELKENNFIVIRKHIDTMGVIFTQKIKDVDGAVGIALVGSLSKLVAKFG